MDEQMAKNIGILQTNLLETWKGLLISAGFTAGIFELLNSEKPTSIDEITVKKNYDPLKLEKWLYFMESADIVKKINDGYILTSIGFLCTKENPVKELLGMLHLTEYFMNATLNAASTFKHDQSLDKLTEGKISKNYQPKVSDNFSGLIYDYLKQYNIVANDSILDVGCGNGSFLRVLLKKLPDIIYTGVDINLFSIELGKQENKSLGVSDKIKLLVGDITEDIDDFPNNSYDWVTAINVFHFMQPEKRMQIIENMVRIARKGIFITPSAIDDTAILRQGNALMTLLFNDFTGWYKKPEFEALLKELDKKYSGNYTINRIPFMMGSNNLVTLVKKN